MQMLFHSAFMSCRLLLMFAILAISGCYYPPEMEISYVDPELCKRNIVSVGERVVEYKLNRFSPIIIVYEGMVVVGQSRRHPLLISKDSKTIKFSVDFKRRRRPGNPEHEELIFNLDNLNIEDQWPDYKMRRENHDFIDKNGDINIYLRWVYVVIHSVSSDRLEYTLKGVHSTNWSEPRPSIWRKGHSVFRASPIPCAAPVSADLSDDALVAFSTEDYQTAARLYRELAEQGDVEAQDRLGLMYQKGMGVPEDYAEAAKWYRKAAEQGYAGAQDSLGSMYIFGKGVPQDFVQGYKWIILALAQDDPPCKAATSTTTKTPEEQEVFDYMCERMRAARASIRQANGKLLSAVRDKYMTREQIAEAQRLAREWKPKE